LTKGKIETPTLRWKVQNKRKVLLFREGGEMGLESQQIRSGGEKPQKGMLADITGKLLPKSN